MKEDSRTLREFYPDAEMRHRVHYTFAHRFLPAYVWQNPAAFFRALYGEIDRGQPTDPTRFLQSRWHAIFEPDYGLVTDESVDPIATPKSKYVFRRVSDLSMTLHDVGGGRAALVRMPPPEQSPEAYFVCILETGARVITLEYTREELASKHEGDQGIICEWVREGASGIHRNFGAGVAPEPEAFLHAVNLVTRKPWWKIR